MKRRDGNDRFGIVDEFLNPKEAAELWRFFQTHIYVQSDARGYKGHWRLDDGRVMRGMDFYYGKGAAEIVARKQGVALYPSGVGMDLFIKRLVEVAPQYSSLIGEEGKDWNILVATARLYEREAGLFWHRDSPTLLTGSATFYGHPEWNVSWGGELLVADESSDDIPDDWGPYMNPPQPVMGMGESYLVHSHLDNRHTNERLAKKGYGHYVMAKPNRLVMMKTGTPHMVKKTDPAAGDHVRASITAFFIRAGREGSEAY